MKDKFEIPEMSPLFAPIPKPPIVITIDGKSINKVANIDININFKED